MARLLVVLLHEYRGTPEHLAGVQRTIADALTASGHERADIETWCPALPMTIASYANPNVIAHDVAAGIRQRWREAMAGGRPIDRIILVGYSLGGLIARKAYVIACGETDKAPFEPEIPDREEMEWAGAVDRIILLAGMNRGWRVTHHLGIAQGLTYYFGHLAAHALQALLRRRYLILRIYRGADFITQLRVQWLRMRQRAAHKTSADIGQALTIQLLGSVDDFVSPADNVDLVSGRDFVYLDVPYSGHVDVVDMDDPRVPPGEDTSIGRMRQELLTKAVTGTKEQLFDFGVIPDDKQGLTTVDEKTADVVFVIHGIRDSGFWTHKIARTIRKRAKEKNGKDSPTFETETSSYGYFPMIPFLLNSRRLANVEWLMDQYAEAVALYPNADFHFVGHSNGTWCLARALEEYSCCRFKRVVFAGSVVPSTFDWSRMLAGSDSARRGFGQVESVLNFVATGDWVVAFFPKFFETHLPIQDLGGAGHDGFVSTLPAITNRQYVAGKHDAAIREGMWDCIAEFIVTGNAETAPSPPALMRDKRNTTVEALGRRPIVVWLLLLLAVCLGGAGLTAVACCLGASRWGVAFVIGVYLLFLWRLANWV